MAWSIAGYLDGPLDRGTSFEGCRVEVLLPRPAQAADGIRFRLMSANSGAMRGSSERISLRTDGRGRFSFEVPDAFKLDGGIVLFVAFAPSGQVIGEATSSESQGLEKVVIAVNTDALAPITLAAPSTPTPAQSRRLSGLVIERTGRKVPAGLQVVIVGYIDGATPDRPEPVLAARTDGRGYFFGEVPRTTYMRAAALVGASDEIAITLDSGLIPTKLKLLVTLPDEESGAGSSDDCGCGSGNVPRTPTQADVADNPDSFSTDLGTGRCVQFATPNRAIEEFDFYSVVRTTEPDIVGFTTDRAPPVGPVGDDVLVTLRAAAAAATHEATAQNDLLIVAQQSVTAATSAAATASAVSEACDSLQGARAWIYAEINDLFERIKTNTYNHATARQALSLRLQTVGTPLSAELADEVTRRVVDLVSGYTAESLRHSSPVSPVLSIVVSQAAMAKRAADTQLAAATAAAGTALSRFNAASAALTAANAAVTAREEALQRQLAVRAANDRNRPVGRAPLSAANPVDWDDTPTFYQTAEIAHGHLLHFKQVWYADGYSLGDLLYSLPLAPGQKKLVSVLDWERRERAERVESTTSTEQLDASISRDRDLAEVVTGALSESARGGSRSTSVGAGIGTGTAMNGSYQGINFGALTGVSGGYGDSQSSAWQDSARSLSSNALQSLRDRTLQSASAVRGLRSSVVHTVSQGEAVRATTEVVANHNHCHALTIQYFEVLRHLKLEHELVDVQECLLVPLPMSSFDIDKALRWRQELGAYLKRPALSGGFDSARRVQTNWSQADVPRERYADEGVMSIAGELTLTVLVPLPPFPQRPLPRPDDSAAETAQAVADAVNPTTGVLGVLLAIATGGASLVTGAVTEATIKATQAASKGARAVADELYAELDPVRRYERFQRDIVPGVVEGFVNQLDAYARVRGSLVHLPQADFTLTSQYEPGIPLLVSLRASLPGTLRRADIDELVIKSRTGLPSGFRAVVNTATLRYRTPSFEHGLVSDRRVNDDIDAPRASAEFTNLVDFVVNETGVGAGATLYTPLDDWEQRRPRLEDQRLAAELVDHLNSNIEYYHHAIWWSMDPNRRFMLLDGYYAPGANRRSVASVVENRLIGLIGNSLVLPVARGVHLDPRFAPDSDGFTTDLVQFYAPTTPIAPSRVSLPTRGVFAEAVLGNCNSCEIIDDSRYWRWEESPIDEPPGIDTLSTSSRRATPEGTTPTPFPTPLVAIQNAAAAPDPVGIRAALDALGKQSFADITGLAGTQANAAAAYQQALDTAYKFGKEASVLAQQAAMLGAKDKVLKTVDDAEAEGKIDEDERKKYYKSTLDKLTMTPPPLVEATPSDPSEWASWPGVTDPSEDPIPPVPVPTPRPKRPKPKKPIPVTIKLRAFVPSEIWEPPGRDNSTIRFNGDGRDFSLDEGDSRAEVTYELRLDADTLKLTEEPKPPRVRYGLAELYLFSQTTDAGGGKPEWWEVKNSAAESSQLVPRRLPSDAPRSFVHDYHEERTKTVVTLGLDAAACFPWTLPGETTAEFFGISVRSVLNDLVALSSVKLSIRADVIITFTKAENGLIEYSVTGKHGTFPAFEIYINEAEAWTWGKPGDSAFMDDDAPEEMGTLRTIYGEKKVLREVT